MREWKKRVSADGSGFEQANAVAPLDGADDDVEVRRNDAAEEFAEGRSVVQVASDTADGAGAREFGQCFVHGAPLATVGEVRERTPIHSPRGNARIRASTASATVVIIVVWEIVRIRWP